MRKISATRSSSVTGTEAPFTSEWASPRLLAVSQRLSLVFFGVTSIRLVLSVPAFIYFSAKVANVYDIDLGPYLPAVGLIPLSSGILPDTREALHSFWEKKKIYIAALPVRWHVWRLCCLFCPPFFATWCFCFPISSSPLSWFIEIEVLITAQANLELTECLPRGITRKTKPVYFLSIKYRWPFLFYFFGVFATGFYQFMAWMTRKTRHLKKLLERFFCDMLHWCVVYELKQPFNWVKLQRNSQLQPGSLELEISCSDRWVLAHTS